VGISFLCGGIKPVMDAEPNQPSTPTLANPILQYDACATEVRNQANKNKWTITILQQVSFGNATAGCFFTGPDYPFCLGTIGALNVVTSSVKWIGSAIYVWNGETQCMQTH
jgi:hypothetical protein